MLVLVLIAGSMLLVAVICRYKGSCRYAVSISRGSSNFNAPIPYDDRLILDTIGK